MSTAKLELLIGNKNYSSWSLRPWLLLKHFSIPFVEHRVALYVPGSREQLLRYSPTGKVPALKRDGTWIWESLAIVEAIAEWFPQYPIWPRAELVRAQARAAAAEMHAGFPALRAELPMNCRAEGRKLERTLAAEREVERVHELWSGLREAHAGSGPWLCGEFGAVDAMFAPVVLRFWNYDVPRARCVADYCETMLTHPAVCEWIGTGRAEPEVLEGCEVGEER